MVKTTQHQKARMVEDRVIAARNELLPLYRAFGDALKAVIDAIHHARQKGNLVVAGQRYQPAHARIAEEEAPFKLANVLERSHLYVENKSEREIHHFLCCGPDELLGLVENLNECKARLRKAYTGIRKEFKTALITANGGHIPRSMDVLDRLGNELELTDKLRKDVIESPDGLNAKGLNIPACCAHLNIFEMPVKSCTWYHTKSRPSKKWDVSDLERLFREVNEEEYKGMDLPNLAHVNTRTLVQQIREAEIVAVHARAVLIDSDGANEVRRVYAAHPLFAPLSPSGFYIRLRFADPLAAPPKGQTKAGKKGASNAKLKNPNDLEDEKSGEIKATKSALPTTDPVHPAYENFPIDLSKLALAYEQQFLEGQKDRRLSIVATARSRQQQNPYAYTSLPGLWLNFRLRKKGPVLYFFVSGGNKPTREFSAGKDRSLAWQLALEEWTCRRGVPDTLPHMPSDNQINCAKMWFIENKTG